MDFACTLVFGICTPFVYQDVWGILWCMAIFAADSCLLYGATYMNYKCVVIWLTIIAVHIVFFLLLLPIIPMMIIAIYIGNNAIENCYEHENNREDTRVWLFQTGDGVNLNCNEANDFFSGLKGIMYTFMTILAILPVYYIFAWIVVNKFRNKCAYV